MSPKFPAASPAGPFTIRQRGGQFEFNPRLHDNGEKMVLGVKIPPGGGMEDGLKVLDMLSKSPATAHFISKELAMRFVSDNPPAGSGRSDGQDFPLHRWRSARSDAHHVHLAGILVAGKFPRQGQDAARNDGQRPARHQRRRRLHLLVVQQLNVMGQPLYRKVEPTGYSLKNADWLNSAALLAA